MNTNDTDCRSLTAGQKAVVDAYLADYKPADTFNDETDLLVDTQTMILEMNSMCNFDYNLLSDYLVEKGFSAHFSATDGVAGWIFRVK